VHLSDPDGNGIELYYDRPQEEWFDARGNPVLKAEAFDPREPLGEPNDAPGSSFLGVKDDGSPRRGA
jgi:catechol-2,3-dioxygenase